VPVRNFCTGDLVLLVDDQSPRNVWPKAIITNVYPDRGTRLYGATTLSRPVLLWPFLAVPILLLVHFGADLFGTNFMKINFFLLLFVSIFLIYKKIFRLFFQIQSKDFLFICNKFLSPLHKKIQVQTHRYCFIWLFQ